MRCRRRLVASSSSVTAAAAAAAALASVSGLLVAASPPALAQDTPPPVSVTGTLEVNYTANFNSPASGSNTFLYNTNANQFALNLADLRVSRAVAPEQRTGFMLRLIEGEVKRRTFNAGEYGAGEPPNVLEAYVSQLLPLGGRDVKVDVGQFVTHVGYETIEVGTNNFFSRNFLFQFPSPFYNAGVRAAFPISPTTTVTGFLYNRYNGAFDPGNSDLAPGFQLAFVPSPKTSIIVNGLTSRENLNGTTTPAYNKQQSILDLIYSNQLNPTTRLVVEGLYRFGQADDASDNVNQGRSRSYSAFGVAGYGIFTLGGGNVLGLRGEFLNNAQAQDRVVSPIGLAYPNANDASEKVSIGSITASYELRWAQMTNLRTLLEFRYDFAGEEFFPGKSGSPKKSQATLTIGQVFGF